jgi:Leucine-rich repeat (LRR) protein
MKIYVIYHDDTKKTFDSFDITDYHNVKILNCSYNLLTSLPTLPTNLQYLNCHYNQLSQLPTLPDTLQELYCSYNQLTSLPVSLLFCRNLTYFEYSGNPLELTQQQINFITRIQDRNTHINQNGYFNDTQNVHNSALQKSLIISIHNLLSN